MTDRELLELAAKAAGHSVVFRKSIVAIKNDHSLRPEWNPLVDDGDALRLAVKLEMQVVIGFRRVEASICSDSDEPSINVYEPRVGDICTATRRAITRAAAELGKGMP